MRIIAVVVALLTLTLPAFADTLIVCNKYEGTVSFIDLETGKEVARPQTGPSPHEVALSPDGARAVVVSYLEDGYIGRELNVFDVATAELVQTIPLVDHLAPHGIKWIGDTASVLVTTEETRDVIKVNVDEGVVTGSVATDQIGSHLLALSPDSTTAYVTSRGSDTFSVIDVAPMTLVATVDAGVGPEGVDVSPDGAELWVGNNQSENIMVFDTGTLDQTAVIDVGFLPIRVLFHPDGMVVAVADLRGDRVVLLDPESHNEIAAVDLAPVKASAPASLLFSPDGAFLYAGAQDGAMVAEIDTATWQVTRTFEAGAGSDGLAISPVNVATP
ncbi:MAG: LpqB family beta-propeller domain-containing protein [Pseudomonadota bacterium]